MRVPRGRSYQFRPVVWAFALAVGSGVGVLAGAAPASAHALAVSSTPPPGATLADSPKTVTIAFSEAPDPRLSTIEVLDSSGAAHQTGHSGAVPAQPNSLEVAVGPLGPGVYTVSWRTISRVDGHLASGAFAFGVRVSPTGAAAASPVVHPPPASTWAVAARWGFYVGVMGLLGTAVIGLLASPLRRLRWIGVPAWISAAAGVAALEEQQRRSDGIPFGGLLRSSMGHQVSGRAVPLGAAAILVAWLFVRPASRAALVALGTSALGAMFGDVEASHVSGERSWRWFHLLTQWMHFAAAGAWLGGLAVMLVVLPTLDRDRRRRLAGRFSHLALGSVLVLATTGLLRGLDEIGSWHGLFSTTFGRWALLKICLLVGLILLGAAQRGWGLRSLGGGSGRALRRIGISELAFGAVVLVAAGFLQSLPPPVSTAAPRPPHPVVVTGHDFATTVKVRLAISPGTPGFNRFDLQALDYDTLRPVAGLVSLTFDLPARPDLGPSTLDLPRRAGGYSAVAPNLSVAGTWNITVLIQRGTQSTDVPLTAIIRSAPQRIDVARSPGLPAVYTIHLTEAVGFQVYLDPGHPGFNELHVTVLATSGSEIPTTELSVHARGNSQPVAAPLTVRRLDSIGHYVADLAGATAGKYQFSIDATTDQGTLHADITIPVQ